VPDPPAWLFEDVPPSPDDGAVGDVVAIRKPDPPPAPAQQPKPVAPPPAPPGRHPALPSLEEELAREESRRNATAEAALASWQAERFIEDEDGEVTLGVAFSDFLGIQNRTSPRCRVRSIRGLSIRRSRRRCR
jgi:hypothetical protein